MNSKDESVLFTAEKVLRKIIEESKNKNLKIQHEVYEKLRKMGKTKKEIVFMLMNNLSPHNLVGIEGMVSSVKHNDSLGVNLSNASVVLEKTNEKIASISNSSGPTSFFG